ncbi:MAG: hypothetical protein J7K72_00170 [Candidatus Aenigmarchaeota archaeon]|nr:hypothetical protein [Candidatus Aenigmarchaeota archaeon]
MVEITLEDLKRLGIIEKDCERVKIGVDPTLGTYIENEEGGIYPLSVIEAKLREQKKEINETIYSGIIRVPC